MSRHDYSQNTVSNISSTILNCKNDAQNTILSTESMSYSWNAGIIHNVVTWFEVLQINTAKSELEQLFQKADSKFEGTVQNIGQVDSTTSSKLESTINELSNAISKIPDLESIILRYSQISEQHVWMNEKKANIYKKNMLHTMNQPVDIAMIGIALLMMYNVAMRAKMKCMKTLSAFCIQWWMMMEILIHKNWSRF